MTSNIIVSTLVSLFNTFLMFENVLFNYNVYNVSDTVQSTQFANCYYNLPDKLDFRSYALLYSLYSIAYTACTSTS